MTAYRLKDASEASWSSGGMTRRLSSFLDIGPGRPSCSPYVLGVLEGEGVGPEVIGAALGVLAALDGPKFDIRMGGAIGHKAEALDGKLTPDIASFCDDIFSAGGVILAGPGGGRFVYDLRRRFDLFCKIVPLLVSNELAEQNRLKERFLKDVDIVLLRENCSGLYQGEAAVEDHASEGRRVTHTFAYSEREVRRVVQPAAGIAASRRGKLTVVVKDGGLPAISDLWRDCATAAAQAVGIKCSFANIDLAAYQMIQEPRNLDVIVAPNLFGDVLADLGAVLIGGRGVSFSGNFAGDGTAVYQTNHGSAFDLAGQDRANPVGQIFSLAMLLRESFGLFEEAALIENAVASVWREGWRTVDLGGVGNRIVGCAQMGELVAASVAKLGKVRRIAV